MPRHNKYATGKLTPQPIDGVPYIPPSARYVARTSSAKELVAATEQRLAANRAYNATAFGYPKRCTNPKKLRKQTRKQLQTN